MVLQKIWHGDLDVVMRNDKRSEQAKKQKVAAHWEA
jgi:hypothetical protein